MKSFFRFFQQSLRNSQKIKLVSVLSCSYFVYNYSKFNKQNYLQQNVQCLFSSQSFGPQELKKIVKKSENFTIIIYNSHTNLPIATGVIIDDQNKIFMTINNVFEKKDKQNHQTDCYARLQSQESENIPISIDFVLEVDNLCFGKLHIDSIPDKQKVQLIQSSLKSIDLNTQSDQLSKGDYVVLVSKSIEDIGIVKTGIIQDISVKNVNQQQLPCISFATDIPNYNTSIYGSPVMNQFGQFLGIIMPVETKNELNTIVMPHTYLDGIINQYKKNKNIRRPFLGMSIKSALNNRYDGAFVIKVNTEGPAQKADIKLGDTIVEVDGIAVSDGSDLLKILGYQLEKKFKLKLFKDGKFRTVELETV